MTDDRTSRRRFLMFAGAASATAIAGCSGGGDGDGDGGDTPTETATETSSGGVEEVPSAYETATSIGGTERDPGSVSTQDSVQYQSSPNEGNQCSGCRYYIEDKNGDGRGACAIVEGVIDPEGWCVSYAQYEG